MGKELVNMWDNRVSIDRFARLLESYHIPCERKKNGNVYAKSNQKAHTEEQEFRRNIYNFFKQYGQEVYKSGIDYHLFDHSFALTADDGSSVFVYSPYSSELSWPPMIEPLWEMGYYVTMCHMKEYEAINHLIIVRKRKEDDVMFRIGPEFEDYETEIYLPFFMKATPV